jgi:hypothetical protein
MMAVFLIHLMVAVLILIVQVIHPQAMVIRKEVFIIQTRCKANPRPTIVHNPAGLAKDMAKGAICQVEDICRAVLAKGDICKITLAKGVSLQGVIRKATLAKADTLQGVICKATLANKGDICKVEQCKEAHLTKVPTLGITILLIPKKVAMHLQAAQTLIHNKTINRIKAINRIKTNVNGFVALC